MGRKDILARKKKVHEIFQERSTANGKRVQMEKDLLRFDQGIELLLTGKTYKECKRLLSCFPTIYGWIKRGTLPLSFRESATRTKNIPAKLMKKQQFAYLLGIYQSKTGEVNKERLSITTRDSCLERKVKQSLNHLKIRYSQTEVHYADRTAKRIYCDSKNLMSLIKQATEDNTIIPKEFIQEKKMLLNYLRGIFDSRGIPSYSPHKIKSSQIRRIYPRITITKSDNTSLLSAINTMLHSLGINSRYNPRQNPNQIIINETESIKKIIDYGLFKSKEKMQELKENYKYWKETKEHDYKGKFHKLKEKIREERKNKKFKQPPFSCQAEAS